MEEHDQQHQIYGGDRHWRLVDGCIWVKQQWDGRGEGGVGECTIQITEKLPSYCPIDIGYYNFVMVVPIVECTFRFSSALHMNTVIQNTPY